MTSYLKLLKWQFILLAKNNIISISIAVTAIYSLIFWGIKNMGNTEQVLVFFLYNDTAIIGLFFIGISVIIEKNQEVLNALFITPLSLHQYLTTRIFALTVVGWLCALAMAYFSIGVYINWGLFSLGVLNICVLSSLAGLWLVCFNTEVLLFLLRSIPILIFLVAPPLLNYFEVTQIAFFNWLPTQASLDFVSGAITDQANAGQEIYTYVSLFFWPLLAYYLVYQIFKRKIVEQ